MGVGVERQRLLSVPELSGQVVTGTPSRIFTLE